MKTTTEQLFHEGDLVRIADDLSPSMAHFEAGIEEAIVQYSYAEKYGGDDYKSYSLWVKDRGAISWYYENQLTLIERGRADLLKRWKEDLRHDNEVKSNLDWIFSHGEEVLKNGYHVSVSALGRTLGIETLWGSRGEGITYVDNTLTVLALSAPFLLAGDKVGWLAKASELTTASR